MPGGQKKPRTNDKALCRSYNLARVAGHTFLHIQKCVLSWLWQQRQIQAGRKHNTPILSITVNCTLNAQFLTDIIPFFAWLWLWQHKKPPVVFCPVFSAVVSFVLYLVLHAVVVGAKLCSKIVQHYQQKDWLWCPILCSIVYSCSRWLLWCWYVWMLNFVDVKFCGCWIFLNRLASLLCNFFF